jgi:putative membrane protein
MDSDRSDILKGALAGAAAGLLAAFVMNNFQTAWTTAEKKLSKGEDDGGDDGGDEPATVKAADKVARTATGKPLPEKAKAPAGQAVHYATGAVLGGVYGALAEVVPMITTGFGAAYGALVNLVLDDGIVPALGLGPNPFETPLKTHAYGAASHSVFGVVLELGRKTLRERVF